MNLTELTQEVYTLTNRADLVGETLTAIKAATLRAHKIDFFYKDLKEQTLQFAASDYYQIQDISLLERFRALKYARKYYPGVQDINQYNPTQLPPLQPFYDPGANLPDGKFFKILEPTDILDSYGINRIDVAYAAGQSINFKSGDQFQTLLIGYYQYPDITSAGYNSWIARESPYTIVFDAAAVVFKTIGYDEQVSTYNALLQLEQNQLILSNVKLQGE